MDTGTEDSAPQPAARGSPLRRRLLVIVSGTVMAALMLAGAFAIGVWVGEGRPDTAATFGVPGGGAPRGLPGDAGGPPGAVGGAQPPGVQAPIGGLDLSALSRPADIIGQIGSLNGDALSVNSQAGARVVTLTGGTRIVLSDGSAGTRADLQRGRVVGIVGTPANAGLSFTAEEVVVVTGQ